MLFAVSLLASLLLAVDPSPGLIEEHTFLSRVETAGTEMIRAGETFELAEADALRARALQDPEVSWSMERPSSDARQDTYVLTWIPPIEPGRRHWIRAAGMGVEAARHAREEARLQRRARVRALFADWAVGERRVEVEREHLARLEKAESRLQARVEGGEAAGLAARRVSLEVAQTRRDLTRAEADLETARTLVSAWCPSGCLDLRPVLPELPEAPAASAGGSPIVEAARAELRAAEAGVDATRRAFAAPRIEAGWQRQNEPEADRAGPVAGIGWPVPVGGARRADRAAARARQGSAEARLAWTETFVAREVEAARAAYAALRESALASGTLLQAAAFVAEASSEAFGLGGVPLTDLLDAWRTAREVRLQAIQVHAEAALAHRRLEALGGVR